MEKENIDNLAVYMSHAGYSQTDIQYVRGAYLTAYELHKDKTSYERPEDFWKNCVHLIHTAFTLAELSLDPDTIAAAIMHDVLFDDKIGTAVIAQKVSSTVIQYLEDMATFHKETLKYMGGQITSSNQELINKPINHHVILISAAKRIDLLISRWSIQADNLPSFLINTNDLLKELVKKEGSVYLNDQLSEYFLKCKDPQIYGYYEEQYKRLLQFNNASALDTIHFLEAVFCGNKKNMAEDIIEHTKYMKVIKYSQRNISSIHRHVDKDIKSPNTVLLSKLDVPLYDITLIFKNSASSKTGGYHFLIDEFMYVFYHYLRFNGFTIRDYLVTVDNVSYFVIADRWENRYRIFLRTEFLYRRYLVGSIAEEERHAIKKTSQDMDRGTVQIIIYGKGEYFLPGQYSSLDYAFMVDASCGLKFQRMEVNGINDIVGDRVLQNGDIGILYLSDKVSADFSWFNYIETPYAKNQLIKYFKNKYSSIYS